MPDGIVRELSYEQRRDLLSGIDCRLGETVLVSRTQRCDALERPVTRTQRRGTEPAHSDSFSYNGRNELTGAALGAAPYGYSYDNIGNRKTAQEPAQELAYAANGLNQYTGIEESGEAPFVPTYDASGNQTLIKTSTGVWTVVYNAANRAVSFTSRDGATVVECGYDYLGRRYMKKVTKKRHGRQPRTVPVPRLFTNSGIGYAGQPERAPDTAVGPSGTGGHPPLALVQDASLYCYGVDFNKNVSEVFDREGAVAAIYDYSPYGTATRTGRLVQPVQWSAEMHDDDLALVYYNYRYYNPRDGRWINRDPIAEQGGWNSYSFVGNNPIDSFDINGQNAMARAVPFAAGAAAVDGLLPIGDVIGAIVIVSAGAYDLSQPGPGTGNCTRLFHGMLQSAVNAAKIETALLGKCKDTDCCWLLKIKAATWLKNAIARDTINSKCYQGGDSGHRKASEQAWTNVINCQRKIKIKCNG